MATKHGINSSSDPSTKIATVLADVLAPLACPPIEIPVQNWTINFVSELPCSIAEFIQSIMNLSPYNKYVNVLEEVLDIGRIKGYFPLGYKNCTPLQLYNFCKFLESPDGSKLVSDIAMPEEEAAADVLQHQIQEMNDHLKAVRTKYESRFNELKVQIAIEDANMKQELNKVRLDYVPACDFKKMDDAELERICWAKFVANYREPRTEQTEFRLQLAKQMYGKVPMVGFIRQKSVRDAICKYAKHKFETFQKGNDAERVVTFRRHLEKMGEQVEESSTPLAQSPESPLLETSAAKLTISTPRIKRKNGIDILILANRGF